METPGPAVNEFRGDPTPRRALPTRRTALQAIGAFAALALAPGAAWPRADRPSVGAIRWDAWYDPADGAVARAVEVALGPATYHDRMPFFGRETGQDSVRIDGDLQAVIDREIVAASRAGLDYWAFMGYAPDDPMTNALNLYLASASCRQIAFCMIGSIANGGTRAHVSERTTHELALMKEDGYVRVLEGRPLYYLLADFAKADRRGMGRRPRRRRAGGVHQVGGEITRVGRSLYRAAGRRRRFGAGDRMRRDRRLCDHRPSRSILCTSNSPKTRANAGSRWRPAAWRWCRPR